MAVLSSKRIEMPSLDRLLSKGVVDGAVLGTKILCGVVCVLFLVVIVKEISATKALMHTAMLELENGPKPSDFSNPAVNKATRQDYSVLVNKPLLGAVDSGAPRGPAAPVVKPGANTPLELVGTFIEQGTQPYAIIEDKKKKIQEVFTLEKDSNLIFGEATLKKIEADRVEIERNGQREMLVLDEFADSRPDMKGGVAALDNNQYIVDRAELDRSLENLPLLLTQARAVPYFKDGISVGLRLFAIKADSMYEKLGLRNGDILKAVNGSSLGDITQAVKLFETLKAEGSLALKLERNMEEKEFKYEIR